MKRMFFILLSVILSLSTELARAQEYTFKQCLDQALSQNLTVRQQILTSNLKEVNLTQSQNSRFPSVDANVRQQYSNTDNQSSTTGDWSREGAFSTSGSINASVNLFSGLRIKNSIEQAKLDLLSGQADVAVQKETLTLQILDQYLQLLYADEQVRNSKSQLDLTKQQLDLAKAKVDAGTLSRADYLQVESQYFSEQTTLTNAENLYESNRISLMQLMEIPVNKQFRITQPDLTDLPLTLTTPNSYDLYLKALEIKPQIESAELSAKSAEMGIKIAKAGYMPSLSLDAGITTNYSDRVNQLSFSSQLNHNLTPAVGLTLSIPIYKQGSTKAQVSTAMIQSSQAKLQLQNTQNQLRKSIENACLDFSASLSKYQSTSAQYQSSEASYEVASERFSRGVINAVDLLYQKTAVIQAQSALLQAKYNVLYASKVLDFYSGKEITF
ncbi:MAG: TolC family protein [Sphingobacteriia bacterium]|nr:TolC family protein [Sphingobacteriia bacterium]